MVLLLLVHVRVAGTSDNSDFGTAWDYLSHSLNRLRLSTCRWLEQDPLMAGSCVRCAEFHDAGC